MSTEISFTECAGPLTAATPRRPGPATPGFGCAPPSHWWDGPPVLRYEVGDFLT